MSYALDCICVSYPHDEPGATIRESVLELHEDRLVWIGDGGGATHIYEELDPAQRRKKFESMKKRYKSGDVRPAARYRLEYP